MALVLAIEPDTRQADIVKYIVRDLVQAELILVASREEAIAAIDQRLPDVILLTALLSPRDEDELVAHLRRLGAAEHLQTHTIPLLSGSRSTEQSSRGGGLLGKFRKKKEAEPIAGCDPEMFAAEIRAFLARADELKAEARETARMAEFSRATKADAPAADLRADFTPSQLDDAPMAEPLPSEPAVESSWSSPFEWKSSYSASSLASQAKVAEEGRTKMKEVGAVLSRALEGKPHLLGEPFTAADIMIGSTLGWAAFMGLLADHPVLQEYVQRLMQRPAYQRAQS